MPSVGRAASCPTGAPAAERAEAEQKLQAIHQALRDEARRGRVWFWGWTIGSGALPVGQLAPVPFVSDKGLRADLVVGAATSAVGLIGVLASRPESIPGAEALDAMPSPAADPCAELSRAEDLLDRAARDEAFATGWLMHGANLLVNVAAGLVLGLGYDRWDSAAITAGSGFVIGEAQILTAPTHLIGWSPPGSGATAPSHAILVPWLTPTSVGLVAAASF